MIWPPENVCLSVDPEGPRFWRHREGIAVGHPNRVCLMKVSGEDGLWADWSVSNRSGSYATLAMAIRIYDPFQREVG
jgi:hypothetical protein